MTVWTPNNCPLASADLLSEVYFGKSHFLPLHKGYRPHLGKCDFDETFISGARNRMRGWGWGVGGGGKSVGRVSEEDGGDIEGIDLRPSEKLLKMPPSFCNYSLNSSTTAVDSV